MTRIEKIAHVKKIVSETDYNENWDLLLNKLTNEDYTRDDDEIKTEKSLFYYVDTFLEGGYVLRKEDGRSTDGEIKTIKVRDVKSICEDFIKEDFKTIQQVFWSRYKHEIKKQNSVTSKEIYDTIQKIKQEVK